jgi:hypothetical protein
VAVIRDGENRRGVSACSGQARRRTLFVSETNTVELEFVVRNMPLPPPPSTSAEASSSSLLTPQFIIQFQFTGCPNIIPPTGSTVTRDRNVLTIRCNLTGDGWQLTCAGTQWIGTVGNCSTHATQTSWSSDDFFSQSGSFPLGILIVVAVGVALGVFLGGTMLLLASMFMKRRQRRLGLGRPDGSDDLKAPDHDGDGDRLDYAGSAMVGDQLRAAKHYILPDYNTRKDYVVGATADVISCGYDVTDYATEQRDRMLQQQLQRPCGAGGTLIGGGLQMQPRIHYHVYESPQMT